MDPPFNLHIAGAPTMYPIHMMGTKSSPVATSCYEDTIQLLRQNLLRSWRRFEHEQPLMQTLPPPPPHASLHTEFNQPLGISSLPTAASVSSFLSRAQPQNLLTASSPVSVLPRDPRHFIDMQEDANASASESPNEGKAASKRT